MTGADGVALLHETSDGLFACKFEAGGFFLAREVEAEKMCDAVVEAGLDVEPLRTGEGGEVSFELRRAERPVDPAPWLR